MERTFAFAKVQLVNTPMGERTRAATCLPEGSLKTMNVFPFDESVSVFHESIEIKNFLNKPKMFEAASEIKLQCFLYRILGSTLVWRQGKVHAISWISPLMQHVDRFKFSTKIKRIYE